MSYKIVGALSRLLLRSQSLGKAIVLPALIFLSVPSLVADNVDCVPIQVPFVWLLTQQGQHYGRATVYDYLGPIGNQKSATAPFTGSFSVSYIHHPPNDYCEQITPLPTETTLIVEGTHNWFLMDSTLGTDLLGHLVDTYADAKAYASLLPAFDTQKIGTNPFGWTDSATRKSQFTVGITHMDYSAYATADTKYGVGFPVINQVAAWSELWVTGYLQGEGRTGSTITIPITYLVPVPEPSSLLLLGTSLLGFAGIIRRK